MLRRRGRQCFPFSLASNSLSILAGFLKHVPSNYFVCMEPLVGAIQYAARPAPPIFRSSLTLIELPPKTTSEHIAPDNKKHILVKRARL